MPKNTQNPNPSELHGNGNPGNSDSPSQFDAMKKQLDYLNNQLRKNKGGTGGSQRRSNIKKRDYGFDKGHSLPDYDIFDYLCQPSSNLQENVRMNFTDDETPSNNLIVYEYRFSYSKSRLCVQAELFADQICSSGLELKPIFGTGSTSKHKKDLIRTYIYSYIKSVLLGLYKASFNVSDQKDNLCFIGHAINYKTLIASKFTEYGYPYKVSRILAFPDNAHEICFAQFVEDFPKIMEDEFTYSTRSPIIGYSFYSLKYDNILKRMKNGISDYVRIIDLDSEELTSIVGRYANSSQSFLGNSCFTSEKLEKWLYVPREFPIITNPSFMLGKALFIYLVKEPDSSGNSVYHTLDLDPLIDKNIKHEVFAITGLQVTGVRYYPVPERQPDTIVAKEPADNAPVESDEESD